MLWFHMIPNMKQHTYLYMVHHWNLNSLVMIRLNLSATTNCKYIHTLKSCQSGQKLDVLL